MIETFVLLLTAYLLANFVLQPEWLVARKRQLPYFAGHLLVVGLTASLLLGGLPWTLLAILVATHGVMDVVKLSMLPDTLAAFLLDQFVRLSVILALALCFPEVWQAGWWGTLSPAQWRFALAMIVLLGGVIAVLQPGASLIAKATESFSVEIGEAQTVGIRGLTDGGRYIGYLERLLVMMLVLADIAAGVGFLITAKSILRFGDVKESAQRKMTEYIIIGTFMSFGWGVFVALLTQACLAWVRTGTLVL